MTQWIKAKRSLILWLAITAVIAVALGYIQLEARDKSALLPGKTSHGHYQIEMECAACHTGETKENVFTSSGVPNSACNACHGEDLEHFSDSHPTRKFKNPENAVFLQHIDALACVTCHSEHNEKITHPMAVTIPDDFCAHCHEVTLQNLESHKHLEYHTCANAGCHNYHDNMALAPSFLIKHYGESAILPDAVRTKAKAIANLILENHEQGTPLTIADANAPADYSKDASINAQWEHSAHARAGINCADCHDDTKTGAWIPKPDHSSCRSCHDAEVTDFMKGKHGMRLAHDALSPLRPDQARQPMKASAHATMSCASCHTPHSYDRQFASQKACLQCHNDEHSLAYEGTAHHRLWQQETAGAIAAGQGVTCASCHMPREKVDGEIVVQHDQSANLRPNEKMLRNVCMNCHGLQFAMDALSDSELIRKNFHKRPDKTHPGIGWAVESAVERGDKRVIDLKQTLQSNSTGDGPTPSPATHRGHGENKTDSLTEPPSK